MRDRRCGRVRRLKSQLISTLVAERPILLSPATEPAGPPIDSDDRLGDRMCDCLHGDGSASSNEAATSHRELAKLVVAGGHVDQCRSSWPGNSGETPSDGYTTRCAGGDAERGVRDCTLGGGEAVVLLVVELVEP